MPVTYIPKVGDRIEISFDRLAVAQKLGMMLSTRKGAGLIIDYGQNYTPTNTLRAIKNHKFEDVFCDPGELDVTSDVDFASLKRITAGTFFFFFSNNFKKKSVCINFFQ